MSVPERIEVEPAKAPAPRKLARLKIVPAAAKQHSWPRGLFPVTILALLGAGLIGHLVIQTSIQEQGFELAGLQSQAEYLSAQQSMLQAILVTQSTPQQLAYSASQIGMVVNPYSTFINLTTVKQPYVEMSSNIVDCMMARLGDKARDGKKIILDTTLIPRKTTIPPAG